MVQGKKGLTESESILQYWEALDAKSVGARELKTISAKFSEEFGGRAMSPAAIARTLADKGVPLCHWEVLEFDTGWRERQLLGITPRQLETIDDAIAMVDDIKTLARTLEGVGLRRLREQVLKIQQELELLARSPMVGEKIREIAPEVARWLTIWLQTPAVFDEWLSLRRNTPEFLNKFG